MYAKYPPLAVRSHSEIFESLDVRVHSPQPCHARLKRDHRRSVRLVSSRFGSRRRVGRERVEHGSF